MGSSSVLDPVAGDHVVHFYEDDAGLVRILAEYLRGALIAGGVGVAIARSDRLANVRATLTAAGEDVVAAEACGRLVLRDADETLRLFEAGGAVDAAGFDRVIGGILQSACSGGREARAYGEMVARLWDRGAVPAAIELERLWNDMGTRFPFALLCAYPAGIANDSDSAESFSDICACHTHVLDGAPTLTTEASRRYPAVPRAARLARRFVRASLDRWGYGDLADDAQLVVGELTANAAAYGGPEFTCGVSRVDGRVRIEVGDASSADPVIQALNGQGGHGRGLRLVDAVAQSWGWISASPGKVVWAELAGRNVGHSAG